MIIFFLKCISHPSVGQQRLRPCESARMGPQNGLWGASGQWATRPHFSNLGTSFFEKKSPYSNMGPHFPNISFILAQYFLMCLFFNRQKKSRFEDHRYILVSSCVTASIRAVCAIRQFIRQGMSAAKRQVGQPGCHFEHARDISPAHRRLCLDPPLRLSV